MTTLLFLMGFLRCRRCRARTRLVANGPFASAGSPHAALGAACAEAPARSYGPMARLFDRRDLEFLESQGGCRPGMTSSAAAGATGGIVALPPPGTRRFSSVLGDCRFMAPVSDVRGLPLTRPGRFWSSTDFISRFSRIVCWACWCTSDRTWAAYGGRAAIAGSARIGPSSARAADRCRGGSLKRGTRPGNPARVVPRDIGKFACPRVDTAAVLFIRPFPNSSLRRGSPLREEEHFFKAQTLAY